MATKKSNANLTTVFIALLAFIGGFTPFIIDTYLSHHPERATAEVVDGLYIFLKSKPKDGSFHSLGMLNTNSLSRMIESTQGKKGGQAVLTALQNLLSESSFDGRLRAMVQLARAEKEGCEGLVFHDDITSCEAIKFNN